MMICYLLFDIFYVGVRMCTKTNLYNILKNQTQFKILILMYRFKSTKIKTKFEYNRYQTLYTYIEYNKYQTLYM